MINRNKLIETLQNHTYFYRIVLKNYQIQKMDVYCARLKPNLKHAKHVKAICAR